MKVTVNCGGASRYSPCSPTSKSPAKPASISVRMRRHRLKDTQTFSHMFLNESLTLLDDVIKVLHTPQLTIMREQILFL
jgi:hypothetical protein